MSNIEAVASVPETPPSADLNEIFQTKSVKFAFLYPGSEPGQFKTFMPLVKCRDFLNDILHSKATGEDIDIYGLEIASEDVKLDKSVTRLLIQLPSAEQRAKFVDNFEFILDKEFQFFNVSPSRLFEVKENSNWLILEGDKYWQSATYLISLYTYMCRSSLYMDRPDSEWAPLGDGCGIDAEYMSSLRKKNFFGVLPKMREIQVNKSPSPSGWTDVDIDFVHDSGGILTLFRLLSGSDYYGAYQDSNFYVQELKRLGCA